MWASRVTRSLPLTHHLHRDRVVGHSVFGSLGLVAFSRAKSTYSHSRHEYTPEEEAIIIQRRADKFTFERIAAELGRNRETVRLHFRHRLDEQPHHSNRFSPEDDATILRRREQGATFRKIASELSHPPVRNPASVRARFAIHLGGGAGQKREFYGNALDDEIVRLRDLGIPWREIAMRVGKKCSGVESRYHFHITQRQRPQERCRKIRNQDMAQLLELRQNQGMRWKEIANIMQSRAHILQYAYRRHIDRTQSVGKVRTHGGSFTAEEDAKIIKLREEKKSSWLEISSVLATRTRVSVQSRYFRHLKKAT